MFTGLVQALGEIAAIEPDPQGRLLGIRWPGLAEPMELGESVAVNGCCLTVVSSAGEDFSLQAGPETLSRTNLGQLAVGDRVNLERALKVGDRLGGHFVQGHIDTTAILESRKSEGEWDFFRFRIDPEWSPLLVAKGSIALDGVSLTLMDVDAEGFSIMVIPHTQAVTTLGALRTGSRVNVEADILAKHVQRLLEANPAANRTS